MALPSNVMAGAAVERFMADYAHTLEAAATDWMDAERDFHDTVTLSGAQSEQLPAAGCRPARHPGRRGSVA
ncbi:MAG: hypothetical protein AVDCRST_MAG77-5620 [uncultured Chloroflexi bacterium]|uniref:Uncharacterized protein n=1 Tax=uncultured Chloroflexota bacterium TaxID=166587 RepID=A0A6J4K646_9CHLR|nr:MAG: hypothetical protein AVDCRST_MAG77-5620 [uncultured Chloroflexota bacterium]